MRALVQVRGVGLNVSGGADGDDAVQPSLGKDAGPEVGVSRPGDVVGGFVVDLDVPVGKRGSGGE